MPRKDYNERFGGQVADQKALPLPSLLMQPPVVQQMDIDAEKEMPDFFAITRSLG